MNVNFHDLLKGKMKTYVHLVYRITKVFPRDELYGVTSQLRRAAMSVVLNYVEGYARQRTTSLKYFLEMSYGSLKESVFLLGFSFDEKYVKDLTDYDQAKKLADEIGAMLWKTIGGIKENLENNKH